MRFLLTPLLVLLLGTCARAQTQVGSDIYGDTPGYSIGTSLALSADGTRLIISTDNGFPDDFVRAYDLINDEWVAVGRDLKGRGNGSDHMRVSLSADGQRLVYGEPTRDDSPGQVYVHNWSGDDWDAGIILGGVTGDDGFGAALDLSADGNTLIVGSPDGDTAAGSSAGGVRVFRYGAFWEEITGGFAVGEADDRVGTAVQISADGNRIAYSITGGFTGPSSSGSIDVFDYDGSNWSRVGQPISGSAAGDRLGLSLSMTPDGNHLAMGGPGDPWRGVYRVMELVGGDWQTVGEEYRGGNANIDYLGETLQLSDDGQTLILPSLIAEGPAGIYIETLVNGSWTSGAADFPSPEDEFGFGNALSGNLLAFSDLRGQLNGEFLGVVRVYDIAELTPVRQPSIPLAKLCPNPTGDRLNVAGVTFSEGLIVDGSGRTVRKFANGTISTLGLPAGAYFVRLRTEEGWAVGRFLKR